MTTNKYSIKIELNIFSGRRNPTWELSEPQIEELKQKVRMPLPAAKQKTAPQLGYRGLALINFNGVQDFPELIYVYENVLAIQDKNTINYYEDINHVEQWLINQAREHGYGKTIEEALRYIHR